MASNSQTDAPPLIVGITGRMGAGKTTVGTYLKSHWDFQYLRYSLVLADWFQTDPEAKARLQQVGWDVMSGDGQRELNRRLIAQVNGDQDCAIDGLRDPIDFECLRHQFGSRFFLIYIDAPTQVRFERLQPRYQTYESFLAADSHPVESKIDLLKPFATRIVSGLLSREDLVAEAERLI